MNGPIQDYMASVERERANRRLIAISEVEQALRYGNKEAMCRRRSLNAKIDRIREISHKAREFTWD